jgi:DNA polymerase III subunit alpha
MEEAIRLICGNDFHGYFNIVADATKAAKGGKYIRYVVPGSAPDPLLIKPGRGSSGGFLEAYLMDVTALDPIRNDLLFDRFLRPGRGGFPDIDVDYPQSQRPKIKEYLAARQGHDHVCGVGTPSRSGPKQTMRDSCRAMGINFADTKETVALIEDIKGVEAEIEADLDGEPPTWEEVLEGRGSALADRASKYPNHFEKMNEMTGLVRQADTHAAGILIAHQPLLLDWPLLGGLESSSSTRPPLRNLHRMR